MECATLRRTLTAASLLAVVLAAGSRAAAPVAQGPAPVPEKPQPLRTLQGKAVEVTDGDTFTLEVDKTKHRIALAEVDAPEVGQRFHEEAKQALARRVLGKIVVVQWREADRYGRIVGIVRADGACVNTQLVREGWAWHYRAYSESKALAQAEVDAKKAKRGLWAEANPVPPWQWRRIQDAAGAKAAQAGAAKGAAAGDAPQKAQAQVQPSRSFWLSAVSEIRHNSTCPYYRKSKGRACGPNEGRPCKVCGG